MAPAKEDAVDDVEGQLWNRDNHAQHELEITEAAGLFLIWSMLVSVEGTIRLVANANPDGGLTPAKGFPPAALFAGGIAECIFGVLGLILAVYVLMFKMRKAASSLLVGFLVVAAVLGWFVFITYVLAQPLYQLANLDAGRFGFSRGLDRFLIILGIVTSVVWCAALQSGQFVLAMRLWKMVTGHRDTLKMHKTRAMAWTALAALAGLAMAITGAVVLAKATGSTPFLPPPAYPPHVNIYPLSVLITGVFTLAWGALGFAGAMTGSKALLQSFHSFWSGVLISNLITFCWLLGKAPNGAIAAPSAQHCVLAFAFTTLPVVFTRKICEWQESYAEPLSE